MLHLLLFIFHTGYHAGSFYLFLPHHLWCSLRHLSPKELVCSFIFFYSLFPFVTCLPGKLGSGVDFHTGKAWCLFFSIFISFIPCSPSSLVSLESGDGVLTTPFLFFSCPQEHLVFLVPLPPLSPWKVGKVSGFFFSWYRGFFVG